MLAPPCKKHKWYRQEKNCPWCTIDLLEAEREGTVAIPRDVALEVKRAHRNWVARGDEVDTLVMKKKERALVEAALKALEARDD